MLPLKVLFEMSTWNNIFVFVQIYTLPSLLSKKEESKYPDLFGDWFALT